MQKVQFDLNALKSTTEEAQEKKRQEEEAAKKLLEDRQSNFLGELKREMEKAASLGRTSVRVEIPAIFHDSIKSVKDNELSGFDVSFDSDETSSRKNLTIQVSWEGDQAIPKDEPEPQTEE